MTLATYADLQAAIADFLNREDLAAAIPSFIRLAESRINRDLRHWKSTKKVTVSLSAQYNNVLPADFAQPIRLQITTGATSEVEAISHAVMLEQRALRNDRPGRPEAYALTAEQLEVYPTPDDTYTAELLYYATVPALSSVNTTNWLLTDAPDAYLYGSLVHSAPYLKDDARIAIWESIYSTSIESLERASEDARFGGVGLRMKTRR